MGWEFLPCSDRHDGNAQGRSRLVWERRVDDPAVTAQAQRPGPRDAWIATGARWRGSLQRMFRRHVLKLKINVSPGGNS